jgi:outer membrane protein OmpA-like peptidoglycan-associated protein
LKKIIYILLCLFQLQIFSVNAQNKKLEKHLSTAKYYIGLNQFDIVINSLNEALKIEPNNAETILFLADTYMKSRQYAPAAEIYLKLVESHPHPNRVWLHLAESNFELNQYGKTLQFVNKYLEHPQIPPQSKENGEALKRNSLFAIEHINKPIDIQLTNLGSGVNSPMDEYHPSMTADGLNLVFTRMDGIKEDLFISTRNSENEAWSKARSISSFVNTGHNEGAHNLSADGSILLLTICNKVGGEGSCDIYYTYKKLNDWVVPINIGKPINSRFWESQPSLSADMKRLYFTSNRPGGYGGKDIWVSHLQDDRSWGEPVNLGPTINTPMDEQSPLIHFDGETLYFSSYGHAGMGKEDLFMSRTQPDGSYSTPINLGYPINTSKYEAGLFVSIDGEKGFYASNQEEGFGKQDIYAFDLPDNVKPKKVTYVKTKVTDFETGRPQITQFEIIDLTNNKVIKSGQTDIDGNFLVCLPIGNDYSLQIIKDGYLLESRHFSLADKVAVKPYKLSIPIKEIKSDEKIILKNVFFHTDKFDLLPASFSELEKVIQLLKKEHYIKAEIIGHTDNMGNPESNLILSKNRAQSVVNHLIKNGINPERLTWKGMGESQPIDDNNTKEGRANNRRTEMIIKY